MIDYKDLDQRKTAFVFELDNVLYPGRDYMLQVYYLFANFIEFTAATPSSTDLTEFCKTVYEHHGDQGMFEKMKEAFGIEEKYRENFNRLFYTARLPLKLLLFDKIIKLLQEIIIDRKQIFIITNGRAEVQLNKIRQTEWNGMEQYLKVYYAEEIKLKPEPDVLTYILGEYKLLRKDILVIGATETDEEFAANCGVDFQNVLAFL